MDLLTGSYLNFISNIITYKVTQGNKEKEKGHEVTLISWHKAILSILVYFHLGLHANITFPLLCLYAMHTR